MRRQAWDVHTYDDTYTGNTSVASATLRSDNTVYARLTLDVGADKVAAMAKRLGVRTPLDVHGAYVPSIGLGSIAVTPLDMASAYATLAARGVYSKPMAITKVVLANGKVDTKAGWGEPQRKRVISAGVAYEVTKILEENVQSGTGVGAYFGRPAAGKTGTTENHADAWFCGYTPQLEASVWVGYQRAEIPMYNVHGISVAGGTFPATIWNLFMQKALANKPATDFLVPYRFPTFHDWHGEWQYSGGYTPTTTSYYTPTTSYQPNRRRTRTPTTELGACSRPQRSLVAPASPSSALTTAAVLLAWPQSSPLEPRNAGHPNGESSYAWIFLVLLIAAFAAYVAGILLARSCAPRLAAVWASRARSSSRRSPRRCFSRPTRGRTGTSAASRPCTTRTRTARRRATSRDDPAYPYVGTAWRHTTTVYGPAFTLASQPLARAAGTSHDAAAWIYKSIAALAVLGAAALASRLLAAARPRAASSSAGTRARRAFRRRRPQRRLGRAARARRARSRRVGSAAARRRLRGRRPRS